MIANNIYFERLQRKGSASVVTMYGQAVKAGQLVHIRNVCANIYTTLYGDYTTAKYIVVGIEKGGVKSQIELKDNNSTYGGGVHVTPSVYLSPGDRIFVTFEDTATSTTYEVSIHGTYEEDSIDVSD